MRNSNVPFAYYRSNRWSLCFNTVVVVVLWVWVVQFQLQVRVLWTVKLCNRNMHCSSGSRLGGGSCPHYPRLPPLVTPLWAAVSHKAAVVIANGGLITQVLPDCSNLLTVRWKRLYYVWLLYRELEIDLSWFILHQQILALGQMLQ